MKNFKRLLALVLVFAMVFSLAGCEKKNNDNDDIEDVVVNNNNSSIYNKPEETNEAQKQFNDLMQELFEYEVTGDIYTLSSYIENVEKAGIEVPEDISFDSFVITDSEEEKAEEIAYLEDFMARLGRVDYFSLSEYQQFVYDKAEAEIDIALESYNVNELYNPLSVNNGWISAVEINMYEYLFRSEQDLDNYMKLLKTLPDIMESIPGYVQGLIDRYGFAPNDYMIDENVSLCEELVKTENNPFIDGYNSKVDELGLDASKADKYKKENYRFVTEKLIPGFAELKDEIEKFRGSMEEPLGICYVDGGEEYYDYIIKAGGFDMDADEMYEYLYDRYMVTFNAEMDFVSEHYDAVVDYYDEDYKTNIPEDADAIVEKHIENFAGEFPKLTNAGYRISYLPKSMEIEGLLAYCVINTIDGPNNPTYMRVNGAQVDGDMVTLYTTLAHEGYPGHMLYSNYYLNSIQYPVEGIFGCLGPVEGWARYAENKAYYKMGVSRYLADFSKIDNDLNYTLCGLIDVAVNGLGYKAEDVASLMGDLGLNDDPEVAKELVNSLASDPGLYLPYSAGYWHTVELIKDCKKAYKNELSDAEIYEKFMSAGSTTFNVLRNYLLD